MAKFLTSARTVDMLGRQQIAGVPTAVSELFKNAYDAYATSVRADYFPDRRVLLIRDNGIGMTRDDFHTRWLTIGTDSKARDGQRALPLRPAGMPARVQMGEKGIGRLAIASIGPQLLLITRSLSPSANGDVVVALVQWSMFEVPGLTLDDVVVPVRLLDSASDLTREVILSMGDDIDNCLNALGDEVSSVRAAEIRDQLSLLDFDPQPLLRLHGPNLFDHAGSAFLVTPVRDELDAAMEVPDGRDDVAVSPFQRFLSGFTNTMLPDRPAPELGARFVLHTGGSALDLIEPGRFWEPEDFELTDHTIEGEFDKTGSFHGQVSIYGGQPVRFTEPWMAGRGRSTRCGPFKLRFGYVQGSASDSRLSAEDWALMTSKLQRIGGLYVYRDGIRVLPYGNADNDYLEIERRRTLNVGRFFFSYRRMFGAIEIDSDSNPSLQEKAGREGFRDNGAYRDFTDILKNFLVQIAANYFSTTDDRSDEWQVQRDRLKRRASSRAGQEKAEQRAREKFAGQLEKRMNYIESGRLSADLNATLAELDSALFSPNVELSANRRLELERDARRAMDDVAIALDFSKPAELALTSDQEREWLSYKKIAAKGKRELQTARDKATEFVERSEVDAASDAKAAASAARVKRVLATIDAAHAILLNLAADADATLVAMSAHVSELIVAEIGQFDTAMTDVRQILRGTVIKSNVEAELVERIREAENLHSSNISDLSRRSAQMMGDSGTAVERDIILLQEQVLDLQAQIDQNLELMQLGQAVQIVSHEFEASIKSVRAGLQRLSPWARNTPRLAPIVRDLRESFAHLDGYLRLFTPLQRRLYRQTVTITGEEIAEFIQRVYAERISRADLRLEVTSTFRSWRLTGYPSTFYPAFINLVDNAIHWAGAAHKTDGLILLDADESALYVRDNGPGVRPRDRDAIFERGFSRRRGGRGLGLALARELLARENWDLSLEDADGEGASFRLTPIGPG
ncbi:ATP-binding protein [Kribbella sp. NPDC056345]|uniref:ATP-binding protein n=1 Tax=Kribbella sp. NPDC056345 TaxID=3345789 RepID=UPI0035D8A21C